MRASVELSLIDISCGGIAVLTPPELFRPELGACYDCTIHLPGATALRTRVQARNAFMMTLASGKSAQRAGFAFVDLRESMLATIQRYIMGLERKRKN
jgi:c-di-GMP-binding flagellar brake protein YcgR